MPEKTGKSARPSCCPYIEENDEGNSGEDRQHLRGRRMFAEEPGRGASNSGYSGAWITYREGSGLLMSLYPSNADNDFAQIMYLGESGV